MVQIVVPSDVAIAEEKTSTGERRLSILERLGLAGMGPTFHIGGYSKLDKGDLRRILTKDYSKSTAPVAEVLQRRQKAVSKQVVAHNGVWWGYGLGVFICLFSLRHYDYKTKCILFTAGAYGGSLAGRALFNMLTNWNGLYARDRFLGSLPAKTFYRIPVEPKKE
eukprot:Platyproteum_vivax@DN4009_c0_g1_i3.p1